jgi:hypothetical protein
MSLRHVGLAPLNTAVLVCLRKLVGDSSIKVLPEGLAALQTHSTSQAACTFARWLPVTSKPSALLERGLPHCSASGELCVAELNIGGGVRRLQMSGFLTTVLRMCAPSQCSQVKLDLPAGRLRSQAHLWGPPALRQDFDRRGGAVAPLNSCPTRSQTAMNGVYQFVFSLRVTAHS